MQSEAPDEGSGPVGELPTAATRGSRHLLRTALLLLVSGLVQTGLTAQEPDRDGAAGGDLTVEELLELHHQEEEAVRLVLLPTVVTTKKGRPILGLAAADFRIYEDTVPQDIKYFSSETDEPISIAFLLDLSGSMRQIGRLDAAKAAIRFFADRLGPSDQLALIGFAGDRVDWITRFTSDRERFLQRLEVQEAYGSTALFDAVAATPTLVDREIDGRKAIVLITDGVDNSSQINTFKATSLARSVEVPIYCVGFSSLPPKLLASGSQDSILRILELFTTETGGELFSIHRTEDLKQAVQQIQRELRFQYILGYYPTSRLWDGRFRRVKVETARGGPLVRTRKGYYAEP
jgi:VWFA-related protein